MIFKNLFRNKWQHSNPEVRLQALAQLSPHKPEERKSLEQLATHDVDNKVRRQALYILNSFEFWFSAAQQDLANRTIAQQQIKQAILGQADFILSMEQTQQYLNEYSDQEIVLYLLAKLTDSNQAISLFEQFKTQSLLTAVVQNTDIVPELKLAVLNDVTYEQQPLLFDYLANLPTFTRQEVIHEKINLYHLQQSKPEEIQKVCRVILAKLKALKDKSDAQEIDSKLQELQQQWQKTAIEFHYLSEALHTELVSKFEQLNQQVDSHLSPLKEQWLAAEQQRQHQLLVQQQTNDVQQQLKQIQQLSTLLYQASADNITTQLTQALEQLEQSLNQHTALPEATRLHSQQQQQYYATLLVELPQRLELITQLTTHIEAFSTTVLPEDSASLITLYPQFLSWKAEVKRYRQQLPKNIELPIFLRYRELHQQWQQHCEPLLKKQKSLFFQTKNKLKELKRLIQQGKYRSAIGLHKKLSFWMEELNQKQQLNLQHEFHLLTEQVNELIGLQAFVATPRKQELLETIQHLAQEPLTSPQLQAEKVKYARSTWLSLGKADDELDEVLNTAFNTACEQAFQVCREHYAEQEQARQNNLLQKQALITELQQIQQQITQQELSWSQLESSLSKYNKQWQNIGEINRELQTNINDQFFGLYNDLRKQLKTYHQNNAQQKQELIDTATTLIEDDIYKKVEFLKEIQKKWQDIGYAGSIEKQLWKSFRALNDAAFTERDEQKQQLFIEQKVIIDNKQQQLEQLKQQIQTIEHLAQIQPLEQEFITIDLLSFDQFIQGKLKKSYQVIEQLLQKKKQQLAENKKQVAFKEVFIAFERASQNQDFTDISLSNHWIELFTTLPESSYQRRHELTLALEIAANIESPEQDKAQRIQIQVGLWSNKLEVGQQVSQVALLEQWLTVGRLAEAEIDLYERVKKIFLID